MEDNLRKMRELLTQLSNTQQQIDAFFDLSPDLLCIADPRGYFIRVNPTWTKVLGFSEDELQGKPLFSFVCDEDLVKTVDQLDELAKNEGFEQFRNRYVAKDGSIVTLDWRSTAKDGFIYAIARVVEDPE